MWARILSIKSPPLVSGAGEVNEYVLVAANAIVRSAVLLTERIQPLAAGDVREEPLVNNRGDH